MTLRQFIAILRARWLVLAITLLLAVGAAVAIALLLPRQYSATASIVIDVKSVDPVAGVLSPALTSPSYMATQVDILESERVALRVVRSLKMTESAEMREQWQAATQGAGNFEVWLANRLQKSLSAKPSRESNIIHVSFSSVDPRFSAAVTNTFVRAYLDTMLELRVDPAKQYATFFEQRVKQQLDEVEKAQARLSDFQKRNGILGNDERFDIETARLSELSSQLVGLQAVRAESQSRQSAARNTPNQLQDVINHPVVAGLRSELARQDARLQEISTRLGDQHPQVLELKASIAELKATIAQESTRMSGSVGVTNGINEARVTQILSALEAQRSKVLKMKEQRDEMAVLQREVEHAQRAYDSVMQRLNQTHLESQTTQTNAAVLVPATEPPKPSSPQRMLIALIGMALGLFGGIALALLREATDKRIRLPEDIARDLGLPVLGRMLGREPRTWLGKRRHHPLPPRVLGRTRLATP